MDENKKFELIKLILDKLLIGLLIIIAGFIGNAFLEQYKNELLKKKFYYENKYVMLNDMQVTYKDLTDVIFYYIDKNNKIKPKNDTISNKLAKFQKSVTKITPYVSNENSNKLEKYIWIYCADFTNMENVVQYGDYLEYIENGLDEIIKHELDNDYKIVNNIQFINMTFSEVKKIGPTKYFLLNYEEWKKSKVKVKS